MIPAPPPDLTFQQTGLWMWLVHMGMSATFAALLGGFHYRLRRPLMGWLARFFVARTLLAGTIAAYWGGAFTSRWATLCCGIVLGAALVYEVSQVVGAARSNSGLDPLTCRAQRLGTLAGAVYGASVVLLVPFINRTDFAISLQFRPLIIATTLLMAAAVTGSAKLASGRQSVLRFLRLGVYGLFAFLLVESVLRTQVSLTVERETLLTGTVVANLLGLLIMGIASLLAIIADERAEMDALIQHEAHLIRQQAEASRLESLGRMASGIAHDFNRVLAIVAGTVDLVREEWRANPAGAIEDLGTMRKAAERGSRLTRRLMILAKQGVSDVQVFRPADVVTELVPLLRSTLEQGRDITTQVTSAASLRMSQTQYEQILLNLVLNAHEATSVGGAITVSVTDRELHAPLVRSYGTCRPGQWICLVVEDSGSGIEAQMLPRVFDPFVSTKGDDGFGIGMMTVQQAVASAEGLIHVESEEGRGTRVEVWMPALPAGVAADGVTEATPSPTSMHTVGRHP